MNSSPSHPLLDFWNFLRRPLAERMSTFGDLMNFWFGESGGVIWLIVLILVPLAALAAPFWASRRFN